MDPNPLTFALLDERVSQYIKETSADDRPGRLERWSMVVGWTAAGLGLVLAKTLNGKLAVVLVFAALAIELLGLGVGLICMIRREWRSFRQPHAQFSSELDQAYTFYRGLASSLSGYACSELNRRLRYLQTRKASLEYRTGLFSGSMERLGVLPILAALYVQFRDWEFGDWTSLWQNVHLVGGLLLWSLFLGYMVSWWLIRLRSRLGAYEALLIEALEEKRTNKGDVAN
jgi:hypothetical protein